MDDHRAWQSLHHLRRPCSLWTHFENQAPFPVLPRIQPHDKSTDEETPVSRCPAPTQRPRNLGATIGLDLAGGCMRKITVSLVVALAAVALAAGCSSARRDQDVATDIKARMFSDPQVKSASVDVAVKDGEATLSGDVPDDGARLEAFKVATDTPGVKHVVDKMTVQTAAAAPAPVEPPPPAEPARSTSKHRAESRPKPKAAYSDPEPAPALAPAPVTVATEPVTPAAPPPQPTRLE